MKYQPDTERDYDGTYLADPALSIKKLRQDAKDIEEIWAPSVDDFDKLKELIQALAVLHRNEQDYLQAQVENLYAELRRYKGRTVPKDRS